MRKSALIGLFIVLTHPAAFTESIPPHQQVRYPLNSAEHDAWSVDVADFNNDGYKDVAVTTVLRGESYYEEAAGLEIYLGGPDDNLVWFTGYEWTSTDIIEFQTIISGDFNEDDTTDLVILCNRARFSDTDPKPIVIVLLGTGNGEFSQLVELELSNYVNTSTIPCERMVAGDFNSDDHCDIAVATVGDKPTNPDQIVNLEILFGDGTGHFPSSDTFAGENGAASAIAIGRFNDDDIADLMVSGGNNDGGGYTTFLGDGYGGFSISHVSVSWDSITSLAVGDLNNDGYDDAILPAHGPVVHMLLANGDGTFVETSLDKRDLGLSGDGHILKRTDVVIADMNGDENADLVFGNGGAYNFWDPGSDGAILIIPGDGTGGFQAVSMGGIRIDLPGPGYEDLNFTCYDADVADMDNDGDLDVVAGTRARQAVELFINRLWDDTPQIWIEPDPTLEDYEYHSYDEVAIVITDAQGWQNLQNLTVNDTDIMEIISLLDVGVSSAGRVVRLSMPNVRIPAGAVFELRIRDKDNHETTEVFSYE